MGLGSFPTVTLAEARDKARRHRTQVAEGSDPISLRRAVLSAAAADLSAPDSNSIRLQSPHEAAKFGLVS
jgi:hypothetical protein